MPRSVAQAKGRLDSNNFPREKSRGNLRELLTALGSDPETRVSRYGDLATDGLNLGDLDAGQGPGGFSQRLVALRRSSLTFRPEVPLAENQPKLSLLAILGFHQKIIRQTRGVDARHGVTLRHANQ